MHLLFKMHFKMSKKLDKKSVLHIYVYPPKFYGENTFLVAYVKKTKNVI
jgi:hypothetical protein